MSQRGFSSENPKEYQLKIIKRQRNISISTGDMFLVQPIDGLYYVGQVIKSNLGEDAIDPFIGGCHLIVIFDQPFSSIYGVTTITGVASEMKRALIAKGIL